jgi:predicted DNA-binding transcriptional regulator YafY
MAQRRQKTQRLQIVHSFYMALTLLDRLMQARGSMTPEALAQEFAADGQSIVQRGARSIRRYLKRFEELGFCFEPSSGVRGIHVPPAFRQKLHVLNFTGDELIALYFHLTLLGDMVQGSDLQIQLVTVGHKIGLGVGGLYSLDALQHAFLPFQKWYKTYSRRALQMKLALVVRALYETKVCRIRSDVGTHFLK